MIADKFIQRRIFAGNDVYKTEIFYLRRYANSLDPVPEPGSIIEYVIVKCGDKNDIVSKMRSIDTEEELDLEYYKRKEII